jgi:hypothetical protein
VGQAARRPSLQRRDHCDGDAAGENQRQQHVRRSMNGALVLLLTCATAVVWLPARRGWVEELQVGKKPPPLGLERILNAPASTRANWLALKGKIVVLEFWAT